MDPCGHCVCGSLLLRRVEAAQHGSPLLPHPWILLWRLVCDLCVHVLCHCANAPPQENGGEESHRGSRGRHPTGVQASVDIAML